MTYGWWGPISFIVTPFVLASNISAARKLRALDDPSGQRTPPLNPGKPLLRRPIILTLLMPVGVALLIVVAAIASERLNAVRPGDCVTNEGSPSRADIRVVDCTSPDAEYRVVQRLRRGSCDHVLYDQYTERRFVLCLAPVLARS
jgi:hypothetical protein